VASVRSPLSLALLPRIVTAYTVNRLGTWFGYVALSLAVFEHTHSALAVAFLLVSGQAVPAFLVPPLVARIEASPRRAKLSRLYLFEALITAALAVLLLHFWLPAVLVLVALDGTAALAASALLRAEAARAARGQAGEPSGNGAGAHEPDEAVQAAERRANAALNTAFSVTFMVGPALAGVLVASAGGPTALLVDVASFLICAAMVIDLNPHVEGEDSVRSRLRAAWEHINDMPVLRTLLIAEGVALVFFAADGSIEVPYAKVALEAGDRGYGLLLAAWGVGVVLGSLAFARAARRPLGVMLSAGTLAVGLAYIGFSLAPTLAVACLAGLVGGVGNGVQWASLLSAVQQLTPASLHGRMMGAVESIGALCPAIGLLLGGVLVAVSSSRTAFLVVGLGAAAMTIVFVRIAAGPGLQPVASGPEPVASGGSPPAPLPEAVESEPVGHG
jgi:MFS family permease